MVCEYSSKPKRCRYTTLWNINVRKTNSNCQQACWFRKDTSGQDRVGWSVQCCTVLTTSLWISGALNVVFVSDFPGLVVTLSSVRAWFGPPLSTSVYGRCFMFPEFFSKVFSSSLGQFIFENSFTSSFLELVQVLRQYVVFMAEWHVTLPVFCHWIKNYYLQ